MTRRAVAQAAGVPHIEPRLLSSLEDMAFGYAAEERRLRTRPTYAEETKDIERYLLEVAADRGEPSSAHRLVASAGAWLASSEMGADELELLRALGVYFVRRNAALVAEDQRARDDEEASPATVVSLDDARQRNAKERQGGGAPEDPR
jgi:hypothetical protein